MRPPTPQRRTSNSNPLKPKPKLQSIIAPTSAAADAKVDPGTSPGSDPAPPADANAPVNQNQSQSPSESLPLLSPSLGGVTGSIILGGKPSRPRHRMSTDKLETLDAFFKFNTHPSRKEKEAISKDLDMDLKTVTIWFQNKRQTLARSRRQLSSEGATTPTAAIDILAHASATMSPLVATEKTSASLASVPVQIQPGSVAQGSYPDCLSLNQSTSRPQRASSCDSIPKTHSQALTQPRVALSSVTHNAHVFVFESVWTEMPSSTSSCVSSPFLDLRKPRLKGDRTIHPEDLWKHIPSLPAQPALSSPDVSPDIEYTLRFPWEECQHSFFVQTNTFTALLFPNTMVTFVASFIGAAAVFARVTSAVPMDYSMGSSYAAPPSYTSGTAT
ncbi:hypothetical protein F5888DRAFT_1798010 [Russula emetica]|nr:hypothetical protein F5888DRAFT_1798010 [Russula emetica]